jgi:hypothetical protein
MIVNANVILLVSYYMLLHVITILSAIIINNIQQLQRNYRAISPLGQQHSSIRSPPSRDARCTRNPEEGP